jgi:hypothetical protein
MRTGPTGRKKAMRARGSVRLSMECRVEGRTVTG